MRLHSQMVGSGPDLIALHGLFGSHLNWQPMARRLSGHFRVHTVDLRNHGVSPHCDVINYSVMADDVSLFMEHSGINNACLLGHSLGGKVGMQLALQNPDRIQKLVVIDMAPRAYESIHEEVFDALRRLQLSRIRTRTEADELLAVDVPHHATRRFLLTNLVPAPDGGFRWRINLDALYAQRSQLTQAVTGLAPFDRPALFVRGGCSNYVGDSDLPQIRQLFPSTRFVTIEGAGHWIHADAPDQLHECLIHFLLDGV